MSINPRYVRVEYHDEFGNDVIIIGQVYEDSADRLKILQKTVLKPGNTIYSVQTVNKQTARGLVVTDI